MRPSSHNFFGLPVSIECCLNFEVGGALYFGIYELPTTVVYG